jgi:hypothetical protein
LSVTIVSPGVRQRMVGIADKQLGFKPSLSPVLCRFSHGITKHGPCCEQRLNVGVCFHQSRPPADGLLSYRVRVEFTLQKQVERKGMDYCTILFHGGSRHIFPFPIFLDRRLMARATHATRRLCDYRIRQYPAGVDKGYRLQLLSSLTSFYDFSSVIGYRV